MFERVSHSGSLYLYVIKENLAIHGFVQVLENYIAAVLRAGVRPFELIILDLTGVDDDDAGYRQDLADIRALL